MASTYSDSQAIAIEAGIRSILERDRHPCLDEFWQDILDYHWSANDNARRRRSEGVGIEGVHVHKERDRARVEIDSLWYAVNVSSIEGERTEVACHAVIRASLDDPTSEKPKVTWLKLLRISS